MLKLQCSEVSRKKNMASCQLLPYFFLTPLLFLSVYPSYSYAAYSVASVPGYPPSLSGKVLRNPEKVTMSLYYESLCPSCNNFIVGSLPHAFKTDLMTIVNLRLVPWGNAVLESNNTIDCQHGEDECYLNTIHSCAINLWPDLNTHFNFIKCIEKQNADSSSSSAAESSWQVCADQLKLPKQPIKDCYESGRGENLVRQFGNETDNLKPPHLFVPWVIVNGLPLVGDYENFPFYICKAYKGKTLPKACSSVATNLIQKEKSSQPVCSNALT